MVKIKVLAHWTTTTTNQIFYVVVEGAIEGATVGAAVARKTEKSCFDSDHSARMAPEKCKPWLEPHSARMAPEKRCDGAKLRCCLSAGAGPPRC
jgi:hypothetical protein